MEWLTPTVAISALCFVVCALMAAWVRTLVAMWSKKEKDDETRFSKAEAAIVVAQNEAKAAASEAVKAMVGLVEKTLTLATNFASETKQLSERLHREEIATVELRGELKLAAQSTAGVISDLDEIKNEMVTRKEWDARMDHVEGMLEAVLKSLPNAHYKRSPSEPSFPATKGR